MVAWAFLFVSVGLVPRNQSLCCPNHPCSGATNYTVVSKDTCWAIASKEDTTACYLETLDGSPSGLTTLDGASASQLVNNTGNGFPYQGNGSEEYIFEGMVFKNGYSPIAGIKQ